MARSGRRRAPAGPAATGWNRPDWGRRPHDGGRRPPADGAPDRLSSLAEAYGRHGAAVYALARLMGPTDEAGTATADAFLALARTAWGAAAGPAPLRTSVLAYAHRHLVERLRADPGQSSKLATMAATGAGPYASDGAGGGRVTRLLSVLPIPQRRAVALGYLGGLTYKEIAAVCGQPEATVKADIRTGLRRLRGQQMLGSNRASHGLTAAGQGRGAMDGFAEGQAPAAPGSRAQQARSNAPGDGGRGT